MPRRVLVTRPEPGASETARRLEALGFAPVLLPLSKIQALPVDLAILPRNFGAVAVTSVNAPRHAPPELMAVLANIPCYAVGGTTAEAARRAGFAQIIEGPGDAGGLAGLLLKDRADEGSVIYLCGRVRLPGFEARLSAAGKEVIAVETYDTVGTEAASGNNLKPLSGRAVDIALLHSALAAEALMKIARLPEVSHLFADTIFLCLSERIASVLEDRVRTKIRVAAEPTEEALLFLLAQQS